MQNIYGDLACYCAQIAELRGFLSKERTQDEFDDNFNQAVVAHRPAQVWPCGVGAPILGSLSQGQWAKWLDLAQRLADQGHVQIGKNSSDRITYRWVSAQ